MNEFRHSLPVCQSIGQDQFGLEVLVGGRRLGCGAHDQASDRDHDVLWQLLNNMVVFCMRMSNLSISICGFSVLEPELRVLDPKIWKPDSNLGDVLSQDGNFYGYDDADFCYN